MLIPSCGLESGAQKDEGAPLRSHSQEGKEHRVTQVCLMPQSTLLSVLLPCLLLGPLCFPEHTLGVLPEEDSLALSHSTWPPKTHCA